jgi:hypothetical protein
MKRPNEKNAAEAFAFVLRALTGEEYLQTESPDDSNSREPDVDYVFAVPHTGFRRVAAEHTIVETFEGQIRYVNIAFDIVKDINRHCQGKIPSDRYFFLGIPDNLINGLRRTSRRALIEEMCAVVPTNCERLHVDGFKTILYQGHQIWLKCEGTWPELNGNVCHIQLTPPDVKPLKKQRLARALADKLPKLIIYKLRRYSTALLLEDISGSIGSIGPRSKSMSLWQRLGIQLFIDYVVVFASNEGRMIVGNVWKERSVWHSLVPQNKKFFFKAVGIGQQVK